MKLPDFDLGVGILCKYPSILPASSLVSEADIVKVLVVDFGAVISPSANNAVAAFAIVFAFATSELTYDFFLTSQILEWK